MSAFTGIAHHLSKETKPCQNMPCQNMPCQNMPWQQALFCHGMFAAKQAIKTSHAWHVSLACFEAWQSMLSKHAMAENKPCFEENKPCFGMSWHVLPRPKTCRLQNMPSPKTSLVFLKSHGLFWVAREVTTLFADPAACAAGSAASMLLLIVHSHPIPCCS